MTTESHVVLILVAIDLVAGSSRLKEIFYDFQEIGVVESASSVYKRFLNKRSEDLNSELVVVVKLETRLSYTDLLNYLRKKERPRNLQNFTEAENFLLLSYDKMTRMVPGENLPHPLLHGDPLTLRCAAEAWGLYEHPVLGQTLGELVRSNSSGNSNVEFYAQFSKL